MLAPWCELESADEIVAELGQEAIAWWAERFPGTVRNGSLVVAQPRDLPELARYSRRTRNYEWLDRSAIAELEPDLAGRFTQALYFPGEAHLDPRSALATLQERLHGLGVPVSFGVDTAPPSGLLVDCTGVAARGALADLRAVKGETLMVKTQEIQLSRPVRMLHPRHPLYVVQRDGARFMIGATMVETADRRVTARALLELLGGAYALHPAFAEAEVIEMAANLRPAFPDNLPRIRRCGRTIYLNGLYRHGFLLAPALARRAAAVILDNAFCPEIMDEYHLQRQTG
jgi:glycine oxidase